MADGHGRVLPLLVRSARRVSPIDQYPIEDSWMLRGGNIRDSGRGGVTRRYLSK
jgi:hypothetical protein